MKQPKMSDLKRDDAGTKKMRKALEKSNKVKITINFDADILEQVKGMAEEMGSPYQTLLNKIVKEALISKASEESRLDRIEKELKRLKKKFAA